MRANSLKLDAAFIAFHPARFLLGAKSNASRRPRPAPGRAAKKAGALIRSPPRVVNPALSPRSGAGATVGGQIVDFPANPTMRARQSGPENHILTKIPPI